MAYVVLLALVSASAGCSSSTDDRRPSAPGEWALSVADEFEGRDLDESLWRPNRYGGSSVDAPFEPTLEAAAYDPARVRVSDGHLILTAGPARVEAGGRSWGWSAGAVSGEDGIVMRDGDLIEARIFVPSTPGMWPAFWAVTSESWPPEVDGFEFFDAGSQLRPEFNYHRTDGTQSGPTPYGEPGTDYRGSWHVYGWSRSGGRAVPYLDGIAYPEAGSGGIDGRDFFPILNLAVRADSVPVPATETSLVVDWVRVWRPR